MAAEGPVEGSFFAEADDEEALALLREAEVEGVEDVPVDVVADIVLEDLQDVLEGLSAVVAS